MVLEKAAELGRALLDSKEYKDYEEARQSVESDKNASHLIDNYNYTESALMELVENGEEDSERSGAYADALQDLREQILCNPDLAQLAQAQSNFQFLMDQVNDIIGQYINPRTEGAGGCGGGCSCSECPGCQ